MKIVQNNSQVSEGGITVKPGQDSIHELIIWKVNPFDASVTCSRYQLAFKWSVNFWLQLFSIQRDGKYFNGWNFYLRHSSNSRKLSQQKLCVFTAHYASKLTDGDILANRNSANHLYLSLSNQKKVQILAFCMWSLKGLYHALLPKTDYGDKGRGHDRRLLLWLIRTAQGYKSHSTPINPTSPIYSHPIDLFSLYVLFSQYR